MNDKLQKMLAAAAGSLPDALMVAGVGGMSYGVSLVYSPAGWIVGGMFSIVAGVILARGGK